MVLRKALLRGTSDQGGGSEASSRVGLVLLEMSIWFSEHQRYCG